MNKIFLIIRREYLEKVKKKSFIIMTLLTPLLIVALMSIPVLMLQMEDDEIKKIAVIDKTHLFSTKLIDDNSFDFDFLKDVEVDDLKSSFGKSGYYAILNIPKLDKIKNISLYSETQPSRTIKKHILNVIENELETRKRDSILRKVNQDIDVKKLSSDLDKAKELDINIKTIQWKEDGSEKQTSTEIATALGFIMAFLIYFFIFAYGAQVMRGVIEEKTSRIVEIIISSVKPFQLMLGKIIGVALVGLTQFLLWIIIVSTLSTVITSTLLSDKIEKQENQLVEQTIGEDKKVDKMNELFSNLEKFDIGSMIVKTITYFLFFFLGGYLLYSSLFAAIGAAVDNETDTQQFMLPIMIPLIISIGVVEPIISNPDSAIAFWFSIIPFTSPIIMMVRIQFDPPMWEVLLSMGVLIASFIFTTWFAGKIYRVGILMYGKKVNYKELWKWIRYSN